VLRDGEPVTALGVTVREILDEVGGDAVRFMMLYRKNDSPLHFDLAKVLEQSKDNPVFYVQYAHARAKSIFRNALKIFPNLTEGSAGVLESDLSLLMDAGEADLMKKLAFSRLSSRPPHVPASRIG
jgi:arginyl-tRNA synthetase